MANKLGMHADLVRATGFKAILVQCHITKAFQYFPVSDGFLAAIAKGKYGHSATVVGTTSYIAYNGSFIFIEIAPNQGVVTPVDGVFEKLLGEHSLRGFVLGHNHKACGVALTQMRDAYTVAQLRGVDLDTVFNG